MRLLRRLIPVLFLCASSAAFAGHKHADEDQGTNETNDSKPPPIDTRHMSPQQACYANCMTPIQECMQKCGKASSCQMKCAKDGQKCTDGCGGPPTPPPN